jgi:hypothetical protein
MKRQIPILIIAAFLIGIFGIRVGHPDVRLEIRGSPQSCPQFCIYIPCDDPSGKSEVAELSLLPPSNFVFLLEPSGISVLPWNCPSPTSQSHYGWLGLGCGGLPS